MTPVQAATLGIVQGLTEFLPVSSSGHLVVAEKLLGLQADSLHFEVAVHFATLLAVIIFFRQAIVKLTFRDYVILGVGTLPAIFVGLFLKDFIEQAFASLWIVTINFMITGTLLLFAQKKLDTKRSTPYQKINVKTSFLIGIAQSIAILPAISRSGSTVVAGLFANLSREEAFRFSFLLSIPAILGASVLTLLDIFENGAISAEPMSVYIIGGIFAFVCGYFSLGIFKKVIRSAQLKYFGYYCLTLSAVLLMWQVF